MAKLKTQQHFEASNGAKVEFKTWGGGIPCFNFTDAYWPLDEFDELVAFVNEYRKPKESVPTRAPEDFIREADEAKDV